MIVAVDTTHVMKVSRNGQVSIPAAARARWATDRVIVVDLGDRVVMRPVADDPIAAVVGKYAGGVEPSDAVRRRERRAEARRR
jgi:bifunctional DNA-binding transcriptional regulator/antitoxin component of YhaV-PrlF toxin-antitoxin module